MQTELLDVAENDQDAWTSHFCMVLDSIWTDYRHLLLPQEELRIRAFQRLEKLTQHIYIRLFQRKGPWFKTSSLLRYFQDQRLHRTWTREELDIPMVLNEESPIVQSTLQKLIEDGFIETLGSKRDTLCAKEHVEFTTLQKLIEDGFIETLGSKRDTLCAKEHVEFTLEALDSCCSLPELIFIEGKVSGKKAGTKTSAGNKSKLLGTIHRNVLTQRRLDGSFLPIHTFVNQAWTSSIQSNGSSVKGMQTRTTLGFHVVEHVRDLFHRLHRLFYIHSIKTPASFSTPGMLQKSTSVQLIVASCIPVLKHEPIQWPGLLVQFRKLQFPLDSSQILRCESTKKLFRSRTDYLCYEIASQLRFVMHRLVVSLIPSCDVHPLEHEKSICWKESETCPQIEIFRALHSCPKTTKTQVKSKFDTKITRSAWADEQHFISQFYDTLTTMHSFETFVLEVRSCLHSYRRALIDVESLSVHASQLPPFFEKYNPGYQCTRILHEATAVFEKGKQYDVAVLLLKELLDSETNFGLERKRGYWWQRLALNSAQHLKVPRQKVLEICERALSEDQTNGTHHIVAGDRVALERRYERLVAKCDSNTDQEERLDVDLVHEYIQGRPLNRQMGEKSRFIGYDDQPCSVEQLVPRQKVLEICERALSEDQTNGTHHIVAGDRVALERRYERLVAKCDSNTDQEERLDVDLVHEYIQGRPLNRQMGEKSRFIGYDDQPCSVEQLVIQKYYYENWYGIHCEGHLFRNVVGLLMWEVFYLATVPDVFQTPYQNGPLDFGYANVFVRNRQDEISARLQAIEQFSSLELVSEIERIWTSQFGNVSRFISWTAYPLRLHQLIALSLGTIRLKALCEYMLSSVEYHQRSASGIPDLLLLRLSRTHQNGTTDFFNVYEHCGVDVVVDHDTFGHAKSTPETSETECWLNQMEGMDMDLRLIEVKGPRDRLSDQQRVWLHVFNEKIKIDAIVMHVLEEERQITKKPDSLYYVY
ncbi:hypothetical protein ABG067_006470 [Albugo candida]